MCKSCQGISCFFKTILFCPTGGVLVGGSALVGVLWQEWG